MSRMVMKNGDIVNLESYDWDTYRGPVQLSAIVREIKDKAIRCKNDYPGQKIIFCFNSDAEPIPDAVQTALQDLNIEVQTWP